MIRLKEIVLSKNNFKYVKLYAYRDLIHIMGIQNVEGESAYDIMLDKFNEWMNSKMFTGDKDKGPEWISQGKEAAWLDTSWEEPSTSIVVLSPECEWYEKIDDYENWDGRTHYLWTYFIEKM